MPHNKRTRRATLATTTALTLAILAGGTAAVAAPPGNPVPGAWEIARWHLAGLQYVPEHRWSDGPQDSWDYTHTGGNLEEVSWVFPRAALTVRETPVSPNAPQPMDWTPVVAPFGTNEALPGATGRSPGLRAYGACSATPRWTTTADQERVPPTALARLELDVTVPRVGTDGALPAVGEINVDLSTLSCLLDALPASASGSVAESTYTLRDGILTVGDVTAFVPDGANVSKNSSVFIARPDGLGLELGIHVASMPLTMLQNPLAPEVTPPPTTTPVVPPADLPAAVPEAPAPVADPLVPAASDSLAPGTTAPDVAPIASPPPAGLSAPADVPVAVPAPSQVAELPQTGFSAVWGALSALALVAAGAALRVVAHRRTVTPAE